MSLNKNMISRRSFLKNTAATVAGVHLLGLPSFAMNRKKGSLRVIAYNVLAFTGWPRGNKLATKAREKNQMPLRIAMELSLYAPDIITFAESPDEPVVSKVAELLGMNYAFFPSAGNWPGAVITNYEITESENTPLRSDNRPEDLFTRHWGRASIRVNPELNLTVHSVHLYPHDNEKSRGIRKREIAQILESTQEKNDDHSSTLLLGDLNHTPDSPEHQMWTDSGWVDTFLKAGEGEGSTIGVDKPDRRIDYVLARGPISNAINTSRSLFEGNFRTNVDDKTSFALSDHLPQFAEFTINE